MVAIQQMRRESNKALPIPAADVPYHCRALAIFVSAVYNKHIPSMLVGRIAPTNKPPKELRHVDFRYLRCIVDQCDGNQIMVKIDHESYEEPMVLNLETEEQAYLKPLLRIGMQLNLLDCTKQGHALLPRLVVIEPDFLLDISAIARCFTDYGHHPLAYTVNRMGTNANSQAILMGSFAGAKWDMLPFIAIVVLVSIIFFWSQSRILNMKLLGDEVAITLGRDLHRYRQVYLIISSLIIGFVVYAAGMIGFVGLLIPHLVRMTIGTNHWTLIPFSALGGSIFLVIADGLCRCIIPHAELPIGILISLIGAPTFVYMLVRKNYGFGGE